MKDFAFKPDYYQIIFLIKNRDQINQADYKFLNQIANDLKKRLQKKFLFLKESECKNDYICDFNYFKEKVPFFEIAVKYPLFYYIVYIMSFGMIGGLIAVILKNFLTKR